MLVSNILPALLSVLQDFLALLQRAESGERVTLASPKKGPDGEATVLLEGDFYKRGKLRDVAKKRTFRVVVKRVNADESRGAVVYSMGYSGLIFSTLQLTHVLIQYEDKTLATPGTPFNFADSEQVGIELSSADSPVNWSDSNAMRHASSMVFVFDTLAEADKFVESVSRASKTSNGADFLASMRAKTVKREKKVEPAANAAGGSVPAAAPPLAKTSSRSSAKQVEFVTSYEGVFFGKGTLTNRWKQRSFKLKRASLDKEPDGAAKPSEGSVAFMEHDIGVLGSKIDDNTLIVLV
jgi:hypothetical protein